MPILVDIAGEHQRMVSRQKRAPEMNRARQVHVEFTAFIW